MHHPLNVFCSNRFFYSYSDPSVIIRVNSRFDFFGGTQICFDLIVLADFKKGDCRLVERVCSPFVINGIEVLRVPVNDHVYVFRADNESRPFMLADFRDNFVNYEVR